MQTQFSHEKSDFFPQYGGVKADPGLERGFRGRSRRESVRWTVVRDGGERVRGRSKRAAEGGACS